MSFSITSGTTKANETLAKGDTGSVSKGATLSDTDGTPIVTFTGSSTLTNSGTIISTGDRALYAKSLASGSLIVINNNAGGEIISSTTADNDDAFKIKNDYSGGSVTINNSGYIVAGALDSNGNIVAYEGATSGQAIDLDDIVSSLVTINNLAGGVIGAADSDAIRPGADSIITNSGEIIGETAGSSGNDGIDYQDHTSGSATINNNAGGEIIGARHGITGDYSITVNNSGTITGQLGSGINMDTTSGTTTVVNHGTISGTAAGSSDGDGIDVDYLVNISNYGSIEAYGTWSGGLSEAITVGGGVISNYAGGIIQSSQRAITVDDSNGGNAFGATTIYNEGSILSGNGDAISITDTFADTITNKGLISGSIEMGAGNDVFNAYTGSSVTGTMDGGAGTDTLNLLGTGSGSFNNVIDIESLSVQSGDWTFSSAETFSSGTTIASGASLQVGSNGATGSLSGAVVDNGSLILDRTGTLAMTNVISGGGTVTQLGSGTTTLSAQNSYSGGTILDGGTLDVAALHGAGTGAITFGSGAQTLRIEAAALQNGAFTNVIKGFGTGDSIDLAGVTNATSANLGANNVLTVSLASGNAITLQLDPTQSFASEYFHLASDGSGGFDLTADDQPCYCRGTLIQTDAGERPVETLAIGDHVATHSGALRSIKWIGRRGYAGRFIAGRTDIQPVCIKAGALADNVPQRDLWISPHHAMYLEGILIEARDLVNGTSIVQASNVAELEYFHIELDTHDIIVAEGALSETFIDDNSRSMFHNAHEYVELYDANQGQPARYCAPRMSDGYELEAARKQIAARAQRIDGGDAAVEAVRQSDMTQAA